jgi:hypothetical protein
MIGKLLIAISIFIIGRFIYKIYAKRKREKTIMGGNSTSFWDSVFFQLFGELKILKWILLGWLLFILTIASIIIYVLHHFITKFW